MSTTTIPEDDPQPVPPERPAPEECCNSGCIPCVYDMYDEAMDRYRQALRAWRTRHPEQDASTPGTNPGG